METESVLDEETEVETGGEAEVEVKSQSSWGAQRVLSREARATGLKSILREIVSNARESGESPIQALEDRAGICPELVALAQVIEEESLAWWRKEMPHRHGILETVETLRNLIVEKIPLASPNDPSGVHSTDPQLNDRYQWWMSAVETLIVRRAHHPELANEMGYADEPGYDGGASHEDLIDSIDGSDQDELSPRFWVKVTSIVAWPSKRPIVTIDELRSAYRANLEWPKGRLHFPFEVTSEVSWWLRNHRPVLDRKIIFRSRAKMQVWAAQTIATVQQAAEQARRGPRERGPLKRLARQWLGTSTELLNHTEDPIRLAVKLIIEKVHRAMRNKVAHPIGLVWVPGWVGGSVATSWLTDEVNRLIKQTGEPDTHWALQAFYDPEACLDPEGRPEVRPGIRQLLATHGRAGLQKARACPFCG